MEQAGAGHAADLVGGPAGDGAVVHLSAGPVAEQAAGGRAVDGAVRQGPRLRGVVELPAEAHLGRVGLHGAQDVRQLPPGHAVDPLEAGTAHWRVCRRAEGGQTSACIEQLPLGSGVRLESERSTQKC